MPQIWVKIGNDREDAYIVHVHDQFAGERREVAGSPFPLASHDTSADFAVNADAERNGRIAYDCETGPSRSDIPVRDGRTIYID